MLKTFDIDDLKEGMFIDSIAKQQGKFKITSRGRVDSLAVINQLKKKGILSVVVDMDKQIKSDVVEIEEPVPIPEVFELPELVPFEAELRVANKLHLKGKNLQKRILDNIGKNLPIDIAITEAFTQDLVSSIIRNPNALMCMTKIREKDTYLLDHSLNVAILLAKFGTYIDLEKEQIQELALAGFLHDLGKVKIPDEILHKAGRLNEQEMTTMRDHVYYVTKELTDMQVSNSIVKTISQHHERLDGYGYPEGLRGDEITQYGRMIAIVDTYDAITADRCYKAAKSSRKALQILLQDAPKKYDEVLVAQFVQCIGIYPVGTLVKLSNKKVAMVLRQNPTHTTKPVVKVFYSVRSNHYLTPKELDLAAVNHDVKIVEAVIARDLKLDFNKYFNEAIVI